MEQLEKMFAKDNNCGPASPNRELRVSVVKQEQIQSPDHLLQELKRIEGLDGEGLMLRKPQSKYEFKRSSTLLKVKSFYDAEAVVIAHERGEGKYAQLTGSLKCRMASGNVFSVGSGMTDAQRADPPPVGSIITYRFQEVSKDGVPRFPSFVGQAIDRDRPTDADMS